MSSRAYIAGSIGQALFFHQDKIFLIDENKGLENIICTPNEVNVFLSYSKEIKRIEKENLTFQNVRELLSEETEKWEALSLATDIIDGDLADEERQASIVLLNDYIKSNNLNLEFIENRLLGMPLSENAKPTLIIETAFSEIKSLFYKLNSYKEFINRISKAFNFIAPEFISDDKKKHELHMLMIDKGAIKQFSESLKEKNKDLFELALLTFSKDVNVKELIPNPAFFFQRMELFIIENWPESFIKKPKQENELEEKEIDQPDEIADLIRNYFVNNKALKSAKRDRVSFRKPKMSSKQILDNVKSQLERIEFDIVKNNINSVEKIVKQITDYQLLNSDPDHLIKTYSDIASKALRCDQIVLAERMLEYSRLINNNDAVVHAINAEIFRKQGFFNQALDLYNKITENFPDNVIAKSGRAETLRDLGKIKEALAAYDSIIKSFPDNVIAKNGRAETLRELGKLTEALDAYDSIIGDFPNDAIAKSGRAETLRDLGKLAEALDAYDSIINDFPNDVIIKSGRAETLRDLGKLTEALAAYNSIIDDFPNNVVAKNGRAATLRDSGKLTEALVAYDNIIIAFPNDAISKNGRAETLRDLGKLTEALIAYDNIIRDFPNNVFARSGRAETLRDLGRLTEALAAYDGIIHAFPNDVVAKNGRAETLRDLGQLTEALAAYDSIIDNFPDNRIAKSARLNLLLKLGKFSELKTVSTSLTMPVSQDDWIDYHTISLYYIKSGDFDTGIERFEFGLRDCIFYKSKKYFRSALSFAYLQKNKINESLQLLLNDISRPVDHLLATHIYAANNQKPEAINQLHKIMNNPRPQIHLGVTRLSERFELNGFEKTGKTKAELDKEIFEIEFDLVQSF